MGGEAEVKLLYSRTVEVAIRYGTEVRLSGVGKYFVNNLRLLPACDQSILFFNFFFNAVLILASCCGR